ncbi:putative transposable element [Trichonephila clavipes]|nr:putative transposable element [Trichonephila clavipes]
MCAAFDAHPLRPPFGVVPRMRKLVCSGIEPGHFINTRESRFNLSSDDNHVRVWRPRGEQLNPAFAFQRHIAPPASVMAGGIIGPYFFKSDEGHKVTDNGDRHRAIITNFFIPELNNHGVQELWFQQYGATCHTSRATID